MRNFELRIAVSNSHVHLSREDTRRLFGVDELAADGERGHAKFLTTRSTVALGGPRGTLDGVRVLTPSTKETWVELNRTHAFALGVRPPLEEGALPDGPVTIRGPEGEIAVSKNVVIEPRHLEVTRDEARRWGLEPGQTVSAEIGGPRALVFKNVKVRVLDEAKGTFEGCLEIDRDEANAAMVVPGDRARIVVE
jgi:putative phosphotransacetylase